MAHRLKDKVALITGSGAVGPGWGNGKATSVLFAREGAAIFGVDLNLGAAEETRDLILDEGGVALAHQATWPRHRRSTPWSAPAWTPSAGSIF
jgi:NAD(P)-dependent dehydrogenase (short-subunit alcohol dehydrogenase family)